MRGFITMQVNSYGRGDYFAGILPWDLGFNAFEDKVFFIKKAGLYVLYAQQLLM